MLQDLRPFDTVGLRAHGSNGCWVLVMFGERGMGLMPAIVSFDSTPG